MRHSKYQSNVMVDQFYTAPAVAKSCWEMLTDTVDFSDDAVFIEPSAGCGAFYNLLPQNRRIGLDLEPASEGVLRGDFLTWQPSEHSLPPPRSSVVVGNPPFGRRGRLARDFILKALSFADVAAMILPLTFTRYETHKHLPPPARLILSYRLPADSFCLPSGKPYAVKTVFQIWTMSPDIYTDLRIKKALPTRHKDFELWQYNNTTAALKYFQESFKFAVPCQGYQDYSRRETDPVKCEKQKQWMLLKPKHDEAHDRLYNLDYHVLAHESQTATPGFRKGTLIRAYEEGE